MTTFDTTLLTNSAGDGLAPTSGALYEILIATQDLSDKILAVKSIIDNLQLSKTFELGYVMENELEQVLAVIKTNTYKLDQVIFMVPPPMTDTPSELKGKSFI